MFRRALTPKALDEFAGGSELLFVEEPRPELFEPSAMLLPVEST